MNPKMSFNPRSQNEKSGSGLRAEDGLSVIGQSPETAHDSPSTLRIQSRCRLVQEQQELRFGGKFNSDGQPLPVLDAQGTDDGVRILLQTAHQETLLSVCLLFGRRNVLGLTKNCGEDDRLTDRRSGLVCVHLLTVSGLGLEVHRQGLTVHEPITGNDTDVRALGEDVQQRGLFLHGQFGLTYRRTKEDEPSRLRILPSTL